MKHLYRTEARQRGAIGKGRVVYVIRESAAEVLAECQKGNMELMLCVEVPRRLATLPLAQIEFHWLVNGSFED